MSVVKVTKHQDDNSLKELEEILELEGHVVGQISAVQSVLDLVASVSVAMGITATTG